MRDCLIGALYVVIWNICLRSAEMGSTLPRRWFSRISRQTGSEDRAEGLEKEADLGEAVAEAAKEEEVVVLPRNITPSAARNTKIQISHRMMSPCRMQKRTGRGEQWKLAHLLWRHQGLPQTLQASCFCCHQHPSQQMSLAVHHQNRNRRGTKQPRRLTKTTGRLRLHPKTLMHV